MFRRDPISSPFPLPGTFPSGLGFVGNDYDFYSRTYNDPSGQGYSDAGAAILNSLNFGMALNSVFSALGGGSGQSPTQPPRQL